MPNVLQKCRNEHARVYDLLAMFDRELIDLRNAERLLAAQVANIEFEHAGIMSTSERRLDEHDWQAIADAYQAQPQAHHDEKLHSEFRRLWNEIRDMRGRYES